MSGKIFRSSFFTSMLVLAVSFLMIFNVLLDFFDAQVFAELESEASYISYGIKNNYDYFPVAFNAPNKRVSIIAPDGTVLADTSANNADLENHLNREEIAAALKNGTGKSERYSDTLTEKTLYYAVKLDNGNILRVSTTQNSAVVILLGLMQPILIIIATALAISLFLSYRVSASIMKPINSLDLEKPENNEAYEELAPLLKKITAQNKTISRQIKEAKKSREEFRLICENMNEGFLVIDRDARVLSYNSAALKLLGTDKIDVSSVLTLNSSKKFLDTINSSLSGTRAENSISVQNNTYNLIANPVFAGGKAIGAVIVIIDITESAKREQLRREFTSNVSHELKTPLTSISGFAEMLKSGNMSEDTIVDFSSSIYDESQRLISLVCDIIKISELDEGNIYPDSESVDLYSLSADIIKRLKTVAEKQNITLTLIGKSACVCGSEKILDEMIYNLCDNAIKYNKPGGTADIIIAESDKVQLTVRDSGIGIPQSEQPRIFERFYRVDKSRSKSAGGTGLGLAIVKHGAMYHNAQISTESTFGQGTAITLTFPKANLSK